MRYLSNPLQAVLQIRIRDPEYGAFLTPGSEDLGWIFPRFRIPKKVQLKLFLSLNKNKEILNFVKFMATKKVKQKIYSLPLLFAVDLGSGIRDSGSGIWDL